MKGFFPRTPRLFLARLRSFDHLAILAIRVPKPRSHRTWGMGHRKGRTRGSLLLHAFDRCDLFADLFKSSAWTKFWSFRHKTSPSSTACERIKQCSLGVLCYCRHVFSESVASHLITCVYIHILYMYIYIYICMYIYIYTEGVGFFCPEPSARLFINLSNEILQKHFNEHFFTMELQEYEAEGISVGVDVKYQDNTDIVSLINAKAGGGDGRSARMA